MSGTNLGSCQTLVAGTDMLGKHTGAPQSSEMNLDALIKAQEEKLRQLRAELDDCDHADSPKPEVPLVEGAPVIAHSTGHYPAGVNPSDNPKRSLKRALSVVSSPAKSQKLDTWYDDAQDPNWTPPIEPADTVCETPAPSEADVELPARTGGDMPPPPPPSGPEVKDALYWKLRRCCVVNGKKASADAVKLFKSRDGRTKLREMMLKNNQDFSAVELELKKFKSVTIGQRKAGQWVTKHHLMNTLNWTKKMADNAFEYASKNNLIRTNEIHGESEAKLVLEDAFSHEQREGEESTSKTNMLAEDPDGQFLESDLPSSSRLAILKHGNDDDEKPDGAGANFGSFKLTFPTIQENSSAISVLPSFIEVCGRKIDQTQSVLEKLKTVGSNQANAHASQIQIQLNHMTDVYSKLETLQKECAVSRTARPETQQAILQLCASCTKTDVALNNLVVRARSIKAPAAARSSTSAPAGKAKAKGAPKKKRAAKC